MKKILSLLLVLTLCFSLLAACTPASDPTTSQTPSTSSRPTVPTTIQTPPQPTEPEMKEITIAEALKIAEGATTATTERYYIRGIIESISNPTYGAMIIKDATGSIEIYGTYSEDGSIRYDAMEEKPHKGDEVLIYGTLQNYSGKLEVQNARLISFKVNKPNVNEADYTDMSIAAARVAETGALIKVDGVVAQITYAFGMIPSGVYLVDDTNCIYIYDRDLAAQVQIGNRITVIGSKTFWILDSEKHNAEKFGYKGCCQLESAYLLENDQKTDNEWDKSWIPSSTVKDILETPVSENITTTIFKVNALVSKVDGKGFVNYYFNDIDGKTGSYTYTQCSGSDFAWLDSFDGKICTVYLSVINAKSETSDCFYRLLPVAVKDEGYTFDLNNTAEHVVDYYGIGQFESVYTGDPALKLLGAVSSDLLGFQDAKLSYTSADSSIIRFAEENGEMVMHADATGTTTVTVSCTFNGKTYEKSVEITIKKNADYQFITVQQAIGTAAGEKVIVKGIVGPSVVNQSAFYLVDETGLIAVSTTADVLKTLKPGQEIIIEGVRDVRNTKNNANCHGQSHIKDAVVLANNYGEHNYCTDFFVTGKTLADFYALDASVDYSTTVFILKGTIEFIEEDFYTGVKLKDGDTEVSIYCSSSSQYRWLKEYSGKEVTLELAACNWNAKNYYASCVLAVYNEDGTKVINEYNFQ